MLYKTIWLPSRAWVEENPTRALAFLCHEYIHILDRMEEGFKFSVNYWFNRKKKLRYEVRAYSAPILVALKEYGDVDSSFIEETIKTLRKWPYLGMVKKSDVKWV